MLRYGEERGSEVGVEVVEVGEAVVATAALTGAPRCRAVSIAARCESEAPTWWGSCGGDPGPAAQRSRSGQKRQQSAGSDALPLSHGSFVLPLSHSGVRCASISANTSSRWPPPSTHSSGFTPSSTQIDAPPPTWFASSVAIVSWKCSWSRELVDTVTITVSGK